MQKIEYVDPIGGFSHDDEVLPLASVGQPFRGRVTLHEDVAGSRLGRLASGQAVEPVDQLVLVEDGLAASEASCCPEGDVRDALFGVKRETPGLHMDSFA